MAHVTVWLLMVEMFSSWDQIHGNTFCSAKRWNVEEATHARAYIQIDVYTNTCIHKYTYTQILKHKYMLTKQRSVEMLKKQRTRAHVDRRIGRGSDCRNQLGIAVITVVAAIVVYIKLLLQIDHRRIFMIALGPAVGRRIFSLSTILLSFLSYC